MILAAEAPAKINRELRVGPRRPDGFHEIRSRFCTIDLCDRLEVEESDRLELACSGLPVPCGRDEPRLARGASARGRASASRPHARIRLEKRVPAGRGTRRRKRRRRRDAPPPVEALAARACGGKTLGGRGRPRQRRPLLPARRRSRRGRRAASASRRSRTARRASFSSGSPRSPSRRRRSTRPSIG